MIAMAAKGDVVVTIDILVPDAFPTAFAGGSVVFQAIRTDNLPIPFRIVIVIDKAATALTLLYSFEIPP